MLLMVEKRIREEGCTQYMDMQKRAINTWKNTTKIKIVISYVFRCK